MKVVDARTMAEIDRAAQEEYAIPGSILMENAGIKAYQLLRRHYWNEGLPSDPVVFVVGKGNNGGDALVIARQLFLDGYRGGTVLAASSPDPTQIEMCRKLGIPVLSWPQTQAREAVSSASIIVDGLTGTGIRGALRSPLDEIVAAINATPAVTISIDVPSGIGDEFRKGMPAVNADITVTMGLPKLSLYLPDARPLCGTIHVVALGFPPTLIESESIPGTMLTREHVKGQLPRLAPDSYKNSRGTVGVFAGSEGTTGASVLASRAAAHGRAGLVTLFVDRPVYVPVASQLTSVMVRPVDYGDVPERFESPVSLESFGARVVGPGWGTGESRRRWLRVLLGSGRGVLDADGITVLAQDASIARPLPGGWVLTPHPGEFSRLIGVPREEILADPIRHLLAAARSFGSTVVLKSHVTYIGAPDGRYWILDGMNPALGTGGAGDVLAGAIGGFLAGGLPPEVSACAGVLLHHLAGKRAYSEHGWFTADELIPFLSEEARFDEESIGI